MSFWIPEMGRLWSSLTVRCFGDLGYCFPFILQISRLDAELTKTRAQLEKGEAVRQNLEFELVKYRKDLGHEKRSFNDRENLLNEVNNKMKGKSRRPVHRTNTDFYLWNSVAVKKHKDETKETFDRPI